MTRPSLAALLALSTLSTPALAQVPYEITTETVAYFPLAGPGSTAYAPTAYGLGFAFWDEGVAQVPLPFPFRWFGVPYTSVYVFTNGFLSFSPAPSGALNILGPPSVVPDSRSLVHNFIAPMWQDLEAGTTPQIRSVVEGSAPNRRVTIEVSGVRRARAPGSAVAFQVRLEEASSSVRIAYDPTGNNGVTGATIAIEDAQGVLGANLLESSASCGAGCSCPVRGCASFNVVLPTPPSASDARAIVIRPPMTPELIGSIRGPSGAYPGDGFSAVVQVSNVGLGAAAPSTARVVLSDDTTIDTSDRFLGSVSVPALAGGQSSSSTVALTMPVGLPVSRYFLGLLVDVAGAVTESTETNNSARDPQGIVTGPDLQVTVAAPLTSGPGEVLTALLGLRSRGAPWAAPVTVRFYLSENTTFDAADRQIDELSFTLPNGFALDQSVALTIPLDQPARAYRLIAVVDPGNVVAEIEEANNVAVSPGAITLSAPDLDVVDVSAGATAFRGLAYPLRVRIENRGGSAARGQTVCVVLSRNALISTVTDPILQRTAPLTVAGSDALVLRLEPVIPVDTGTGAWSLAVVADCEEVVPEAQETNNTRRRTDPIVVRDPVPDLTPVSVEVGGSAAAGEALLTSVVVGNTGPVAGAARVRLVLSSNPGATLSDPVIYDGPMPVPLEAGREQALSLQATLAGDVRSGRYYVGAIVDPEGQVEEVDEANNVATSLAINVLGSDLAIVSPAPPNATVGVPYAWRFFAMGAVGSPAVVWSARWRDDRPPPGLTFDAATADLTGTPTQLGTYTLELTATAGPLVARTTYVILVTPPTLPLSVVSSRLPPAFQGEAYTVQLIAVGGAPPYVWTRAPAAMLPGGLALMPEGLLGGEPTLAGAYVVRVEVRDSQGTIATGDVALDVIDPATSLSITNTDVPSGSVSEAFDLAFSAQGGTPPLTWRLEGRIPGLSFDAGAARLTGTPTVAGSYPITLEVKDARGLLDRNAYVLRVFELGELSIVTGDGADTLLPRGTVGKQYATPEGDAVKLRAARRGGAPIDQLRWLIVLGSLPPGLVLDPDTGDIIGMPTTDGLYAFTVLAFDASGDRDRATLAIAVDQPVSGPLPGTDGCGCATTSATAPEALPWVVALVLGLALRRRASRGRPGRVVPAASRAASGTGLGVLALAGLVAGVGAAEAQPVPYVPTRELIPYSPLAGATRVVPELGDGGSVRVALPFDLRLYGQTYRELTLNANGVVFASMAGSGFHFPPSRNPDPSTPNGFVAGLWGDWCAGSVNACGGPVGPADAGVYYLIDSTPGAGSITVEYRGLRHFADFVVASDLNFQIKLYEGAAEQIELSYGPMLQGESFSGQPSFWSVRVGVEALDGRYGTWLAPCDGVASCDNAAVQSLSGSRIRLVADAGEDVAIGSVSAPAVVYPGLSAPVRVRYVSRHGAPLGPTRVAVYLAAGTESSTVGARRLLETEPLTLGAYETRVLDLDVPMPADLLPSRRALLVVADDGDLLAETDEANNLGAAAQVRVAERAPDLVASGLVARSLRVRPGAPLTAAWVVHNAGNLPTRARAQLYLSANTAVTPTDEPLGAPLELDLEAGQTASGTVTADVPAPHRVGAYTLGLVVDPQGAVRELDETNNVARAEDAVVIADDAVVFVTEALPPATLTVAYEARVVADGGDRAPTLRLTLGTLPRGLVFAADRGSFFGIPLEVGTFPLELEASSGGRTARRSFELVVVAPSVPLTFLTQSLPVGVVGSDYVGPVQLVGGTPPLGWRVLGSLPPGLDLASDGALVGTPRVAGAYPFGLEVRDNAAHTASVALSIEIRTPGNLTALDGALERGRVGQPYRARLVALGGTEPYRWTAVGAVPSGLEITEAGEVVGTPTELGTFDLGVRVDDASGQVDTNRYTLVVEPEGRLAMVVERFEPAVVGAPYRALLRVDGGRRPYTWAVLEQEGALPPGIVAAPGDPAQGESTNDLSLAGTITTPGVWAFTVRLRDAQGLVVERPLALVAAPPPPPPPPEPSGCAAVRAAAGVSADLPFLVLVYSALFFGRARSRSRRTRGAVSQESSC